MGDEFLEPAAQPDEMGHRLITEAGWQEPMPTTAPTGGSNCHGRSIQPYTASWR